VKKLSEAKPKGISTSLVVVAVIIALIIGVVAGYFVKPAAPAEVRTETKTIERTIEKTVTPAPSAPEFTFYVVPHGGIVDPFWAIVNRGVEDAAKALNVKAVYTAPEKPGDVARQADLLRAAIAAKPDGIVVTLSSPETIGPLIIEAREKGIPVVLINVKEPPEHPLKGKIPYLCYIGMDETEAGRRIAKAMIEELKLSSGSRALIANNEPGHVGLAMRSKGIKEVFSGIGAIAEELDASGPTPEVAERIKSYLTKYPDTKVIFTLGPMATKPAGMAIEEMNLIGKVFIGAFDMDPVTIEYFKKKIVLFAVDQLPYLQGFLGITELYWYCKYGIKPFDVDTAGKLVDPSVIPVVEELVKKGYR
jgi:simple sugar transport system substrate-binding protein